MYMIVPFCSMLLWASAHECHRGSEEARQPCRAHRVGPSGQEGHRAEHLEHLQADVEGNLVPMLGELGHDVPSELALRLAAERLLAASAVLLHHGGDGLEVALLRVDDAQVPGCAVARDEHLRLQLAGELPQMAQLNVPVG